MNDYNAAILRRDKMIKMYEGELDDAKKRSGRTDLFIIQDIGPRLNKERAARARLARDRDEAANELYALDPKHKLAKEPVTKKRETPSTDVNAEVAKSRVDIAPLNPRSIKPVFPEQSPSMDPVSPQPAKRVERAD